jgi:nucleoside-diphosphate-sugar epimerase
MPELQNTRILVIGCAGFVGSHIVDQLLEEPVREVVVTDLLAEMMTGTDNVFHLAAQ